MFNRIYPTMCDKQLTTALLSLVSLRRLLKWIPLHTTACKCLRLLGRNLAKQKNSNWVFIFGTFWFDIWLARAWVQETHMGVCVEGAGGDAGVYKRQAHLGHQAIEFIQSNEAEQQWGAMDTVLWVLLVLRITTCSPHSSHLLISLSVSLPRQVS